MAKKMLAILLAILMLVTLFASCQDSKKTEDSSSSSASEKKEETKKEEKKEEPKKEEKKEETKKKEPKKEETKTEEKKEESAPEAVGPVLENPTTVDMWIIEHSSYVYKPGLLCEQLINEYVNLYFNVTPFQTGVTDKINLGLASGDLPDIYFYPSLSECTEWGMRQGALVNVAEYFDEMPNYVAWAETMGDYPNYYYCADGGLYMMPQYGFGTASNSTFWIYRKDLFEKHDIAVPTNEVEVYEACKKLKEIYPESYPFACRGWPGIIGRIAWQWGSAYGLYFNNDMGEYTYAQTEPEFKACLEWLVQMYKDGLITENCLSLDTNMWQEQITTNKGFLFNDYQARIDFFNSPMRETDPTVTFAYMTPFEGGNSGIHTFNAQSQLIINGYACFSNSEYIPEIIKFFDWLYTDEAFIAMNWGREGESFVTNADGTRSYTEIKQGDSGFIYQEKYSFFQRGFWTICDPAAMTAAGSDELLNAVEHVKQDAGEYYIPALALNEARTERFNELNEAINTCREENMGKFLTGQRSMSEYEDFIDELYALGLQEIIDIYNEQYKENQALLG